MQLNLREVATSGALDLVHQDRGNTPSSGRRCHEHPSYARYNFAILKRIDVDATYGDDGCAVVSAKQRLTGLVETVDPRFEFTNERVDVPMPIGFGDCC